MSSFVARKDLAQKSKPVATRDNMTQHKYNTEHPATNRIQHDATKVKQESTRHITSTARPKTSKKEARATK